MAFRDDDEALRNRVDALEGELARAKSEAERLREQLEAKARTAPLAEHGFTRGTLVWIEWRGRWWRGSILDPVGGGQYRVHYTGWSSSWDEIVPLGRLGPMSVRPPGRAAPSGAMGLVVLTLVMVIAFVAIVIATRGTPPSTPPADAPAIASASDTSAGQPVWVQWNGAWYEGVVVSATSAGLVRVHYQGYSSEFDEDVTLVRLRGRP